MAVWLSLVVALVGLVLYIINSKTPGNAVWAEVGRIMFFAGLFVFMLGADRVVTLLGGK